ncbi:MAG: ribonuclease III [Bacilli bacterium]|jgi:ribonuclease-3
MRPISELTAKLGIKTRRTSLYQQAVTHPSFHSEGKGIDSDYERLEFMGDAIISLVVAELVYRHHPDFDQGMMSKTRAKLVQTEGLVALAQNLNLVEYVRVGHSMTKAALAGSKNILEDVFEALAGAVYIDQGFKVAKKVLLPMFEAMVKNIDVEAITDYKTRLQEAFQAEHRESVTYKVEEESGPAHDRYFVVSVSYDGQVLGRGSGPSKKDAEQKAACDALGKKAG